MARGYIKLWRKFDEWEWYEDIKVSRLFIHIMLKANYTDKEWRGIQIKRGEYCTSYNALSKSTKLSVQEIRTVIKKLTKTKEIECFPTNKYTIIRLCNFDLYNSNDADNNNQSTINQQSINNQSTTTKKEKKERNNNNISKEKEKEKEKINSEYRECSELLKKRVLESSNAKIDDKKLSQWDDQVRKMIEIDNRTVEEIKDTINACHDMVPDRSGFTWKKNILSMSKLRYQMNEGRVSPILGKENKQETKQLIKNAVNDVTMSTKSKKPSYEAESMTSEIKMFLGNTTNGEENIIRMIANKYSNSEIFRAISNAKEHLANLNREGKKVDKKIKLLRYQLNKNYK